MKNKGFTLIEIMVLTAIIGVLSGVIFFNASKSRSVAQDQARATDLVNIQNALSRYFVDKRSYPVDIYAPTGSLIPTYIGTVPRDPKTGISYAYVLIDTNGSPSSCESYHIGAIVENPGSGVTGQDTDTPNRNACTATVDFHGNAANCSGTSVVSGDPCFDLSP